MLNRLSEFEKWFYWSVALILLIFVTPGFNYDNTKILGVNFLVHASLIALHYISIVCVLILFFLLLINNLNEIYAFRYKIVEYPGRIEAKVLKFVPFPKWYPVKEEFHWFKSVNINDYYRDERIYKTVGEAKAEIEYYKLSITKARKEFFTRKPKDNKITTIIK